jgi:tetratricopeptide (TPR) repeat protein
VVDALRSAAVAARRKGAADSAVAYLARPLAEPSSPDERPELLLELGLAMALTSGPAAAEHLREAYEVLSDPQARGMAAQVLARALLFTGFPEEGAGVVRRAAAELPSEFEDLRDALEAFELFSVLFGAGDPEELHRLERHRALPAEAGVGAKMLAAIAARDWVYSCAPSDACVEPTLAALALAGLDRHEEGLPLVEEELQRARAGGGGADLASARDGRARRRAGPPPGGGRGRPASAARLEHAKALVALGIALRHARRPTDARDPLRRALELADVCRAPTLAEQARSELHAAGGPPPR